MSMMRNVEVVDDPKPFVAKPKLTGVDRVPIGARDMPESASVPMPKASPLMRGDQKSTLVRCSTEVVVAPDDTRCIRRVCDRQAPGRTTNGSKVRMANMRATAASRSRARGEASAPPIKQKPGKPKLVVKRMVHQ